MGANNKLARQILAREVNQETARHLICSGRSYRHVTVQQALRAVEAALEFAEPKRGQPICQCGKCLECEARDYHAHLFLAANPYWHCGAEVCAECDAKRMRRDSGSGPQGEDSQSGDGPKAGASPK